jgi:hypothetical protein
VSEKGTLNEGRGLVYHEVSLRLRSRCWRDEMAKSRLECRFERIAMWNRESMCGGEQSNDCMLRQRHDGEIKAI